MVDSENKTKTSGNKDNKDNQEQKYFVQGN